MSVERYLKDALQHFDRGEYVSARAYIISALSELESPHPYMRRDRISEIVRERQYDPCLGCGVHPGDTHWDNCPLHPPFSQPVYHGGGR